MSQPAEGNTIPQPKRFKRICGTWNNYSEDWKSTLSRGLEGKNYIIGKEVGKNGTKHLQMYIEFKHEVNPIGYKGFPKEIHFEKAKGDRDANIKYCSKDGDFVSTFPKPMTVKLYGWQVFCKMILEGEAKQRKVLWYFSFEGKTGKSTMCRWIAQNGGLVLGGKSTDMLHGIVKFHEKTGEYPKIVAIDVPRSQEQYLSYNGLEQISNGVFFSGKYEGQMVVIPHWVHLVVFANFMPDLNNKDMSRDRFCIVCTKNDHWKKP